MNIVLKTKIYLRILVAMSCWGAVSLLHAQDIHFSQFYNSPLTLNPALTGVSAGDLRFTGLYRSQWNAANSPFRTAFLAAENRFYSIKHDQWWMSAGALLYHDKAGDADLSTTHISLTGSFTRMLDRENFLSIGLQAGVGQRKYDFPELTWDNQWNGDVFDPDRPTGEDFSDENIVYPDFGAGVNWRGQKQRTRSKVDVGIGVYHFSRPNQSFDDDDDSDMPIRWSMYFMPTVQVMPKIDIVANGMAQLQGKYLEVLATGALRYHISTHQSKEVAVQLGGGYRFNAVGDAFIFAGELHYRQVVVGLSWDLNVSGFNVATNRNGGPEIGVRYLMYRVLPVRAFKACPLI